jgi:hypothetical protein
MRHMNQYMYMFTNIFRTHKNSWAIKMNEIATRLLRIIVTLTVVVGTIVVIVAALASLHWRYVHDSPLMIYSGWLVAHGAVPYRDFFDMNMPGNYFVMWAMGQIFGWNDLGFRIFDLLCLASISVSTFFWIRQIGKLPAVVAPASFALLYLGFGPKLSLQREYLALVPFTAMLMISASGTELISVVRVLCCGFLAGATLVIKPQFLLLSLPLLIFVCKQGQQSIIPWRQLVIFGAGVSIPIVTMLLYLFATGSLRPFLDIAFNYWPLYTHMTGNHTTIGGLHRVFYIINQSCKGLSNLYTPMAVIGLLTLNNTVNHRRLLWLIVGLLTTAAIYPSIGGQFWRYHWFPFYYLALCAASLAAKPIEKCSFETILSVTMLVFLLFHLSLGMTRRLHRQWKANSTETQPENDVPDEIARFLHSHLKAGDTVQPLDWAGGAIHGMLMARAPLATRFMYDFHFYHHINHPYIAKLRREFIKELSAAKPRFIVDIFRNRGWPNGANTSRSFPELQKYIEDHYSPVQTGATYKILEKIE